MIRGEEDNGIFEQTFPMERPDQMADLMIDHIDKKREALGIMGERERVLMDMADRQALAVE